MDIMPEIKSYVHAYIVYSKTFANNIWRKNLNLPLHLCNLFFSRSACTSACATASDFNNKTNFIKVKVKVQVQVKKNARCKTSRNFALSVPLTMFIKINRDSMISCWGDHWEGAGWIYKWSNLPLKISNGLVLFCIK